MNCTIDGIQVQNFRGIRRLHLPVDGHNLILVGENGAGKSSIVDAIEYFFTGRVEPLEGRADVDKRQSIPYAQGGATAVSLSLRGLSSEEGTTLPYPRRKAAIPKSLEPVCDLASRRSFVLRRSQVLTFINARDAERYKKISQLIGLGQLDQIDQVWRKQSKAAQDRVERLAQDRQGILDRLGQLLGAGIETESDINRAINARLAAMALSPIDGHHDLKARREALEQRVRSERQSGGLREPHALRDSVDRASQKLEEIAFQYRALDTSWQGFRAQSEILDDALFEELLTEGYRVLTEEAGIADCPLCEEPIRDRAALVGRIGDRLASLRDLTTGRKQIGDLEAAIQDNLLLLADALTALQRDLQERDMTEPLPTIRQAQEEVRQRRQAPRAPDQASRATGEWPARGAVAELTRMLPEIGAGIARQIEARGPAGTRTGALEDVTLLSRVDEHWQMLQKKAVEITKAQYVAGQINLAYTMLIAARKLGLERIRRELEEDFDRFYQQLHPDEGCRGITIPVQQAQRSSIALRAGFHGQAETHPLSYYSEGHLDSLGLCIFLAFIKRFNQDLKLIVLDDVLTTVDAGHRLRVARLLAREFADYQLVLTTHDRLWANELKSALPGSRLVRLRRWSLGRGVDCQHDVLSDWDYYARQARDGRPQDTIGGAGRNLEKFLYQMRVNLGLAIPAKPDGAYTLGDLEGPFWSWVKDHPPERPDRPEFARELKDLKQRLEETWRLRNWAGAHFNVWAETVTPEEALDFLLIVKELATSFECPVCQSLVVYKSAAKALICDRCKPDPPPPQVICKYKPGWQTSAAHILHAPRPKVRQHATRMARSVCQAFLCDARWRLKFPVLATPDDQYGLPELYLPFFEWAETHPRDGFSDWQQIITARKRALDAYWQENRWLDVADAEIEGFVDAVRQLTALFECADCAQLLSYDPDQDAYFCADCSERATIPSVVPAYWVVRKG